MDSLKLNYAQNRGQKLGQKYVKKDNLDINKQQSLWHSLHLKINYF